MKKMKMTVLEAAKQCDRAFEMGEVATKKLNEADPRAQEKLNQIIAEATASVVEAMAVIRNSEFDFEAADYAELRGKLKELIKKLEAVNNN